MTKHDDHESQGPNDHDHEALNGFARNRLLIALVLTTSFMGVEVAVGILSNSLALISDAGHMLTDAGALALALWAQALAKRKRTGERTFGYRRAEVLAAAANGVVLGVTAIVVIIEAVRRFRTPAEVIGAPMLVVACIGLLINLASAWVLSRGGKGNVNVRMAAAHVLADAAGSVAAIAAGLLIWLFRWNVADPLMSIAISLLILYGSWRLLRESTGVLMEGTPTGVDPVALERIVRDTPGVAQVHDLHIWAIADDTPVVTVHVTLDPGEHGVDLSERVGRRIQDLVPGAHVTVQPEAPRAEDRLVAPESLRRPRT